jgi:hypothetical protein
VTTWRFLTSPNDGSGTQGDQSVVLSDQARATAFYGAVAKDTLAKLPGHHRELKATRFPVRHCLNPLGSDRG